MKKSLLITLDFPPKRGGVANYYSNICTNLPDDKIVVLAPETDSPDFNDKQPYPIIRKKMISGNPLIWPKWLNTIKYADKIIKQFNCEAILAGQVLPIGTVAYALKKKNNIPYYVFTHGMDITMPKGRKRLLIKKILACADGIFANSVYTKGEIVHLGINPNKISIVYPCPNIFPEPSTEEIEALKNKYALHNKKIILTVGRLVERKGHDIAIKSLVEVIKKIPDVVYVIVGNGPKLNSLKFLVNKYQVGKYVIFTGELSESTIANFYALCHCFIMVSRKLTNGDVEGFGTVYLEANLFGKPAIAGRSGGAPEAVIDNKTGLIVDPLDIEAVSDSIIKLLGNESLSHQLGFQGMNRVHEQFTWDKQTINIEKKLMN